MLTGPLANNHTSSAAVNFNSSWSLFHNSESCSILPEENWKMSPAARVYEPQGLQVWKDFDSCAVFWAGTERQRFLKKYWSTSSQYFPLQRRPDAHMLIGKKKKDRDVIPDTLDKEYCRLESSTYDPFDEFFLWMRKTALEYYCHGVWLSL